MVPKNFQIHGINLLKMININSVNGTVKKLSQEKSINAIYVVKNLKEKNLFSNIYEPNI